MTDLSTYGQTAVTYEGLPISSGGAHGLGRIPFRQAYDRTLAFIEACAETKIPGSSEFRSVNGPEMPANMRWERGFRERFGARAPVVRVPPERLDDALDFLREIDPQPQNPWGMAPLWLETSWLIRIKNPDTGSVYERLRPSASGDPNYSGLGENRLRLILSNEARLRVELNIPDIDDDELRRLVPRLQAHAPFKFSAKHWRRWTTTRSGNFRARKLLLDN